MPKLQPLDPQAVPDDVKQLLDASGSGRRSMSNMMRTMANSPAALGGYVAFLDALSAGGLDQHLREVIALTVAEANGCRYCLSMHASAAGLAGLSDAEIRDARDAGSADPKVEAALRFVRAIVAYRGDLTDEEFERVVRA